MSKLETILRSACTPAVMWLKTQPGYETAWEQCPQGDWMLWLLEKADYDINTLRLMACHIVRHTPLADGRKVWDLLTNEDSRKAIQAAEEYSRREATRQVLDVASDDAYIVYAAYVAAAADAVDDSDDSDDAYAAYAAGAAAYAAAGAAGAVAGTLDSATTTAQSGRQTMCAHKYHGMTLLNC